MAFLMNSWYVAAWADELGKEQMLPRQLLNQPVVMFRRRDGVAVALADRCAHRFELLRRRNLRQADDGHRIDDEQARRREAPREAEREQHPERRQHLARPVISVGNLSMGGTDNLKTSIGHNWQKGPINSPTVLNSSLNLAQFWDGRAKDLKEQAGGPIANPGEMASTHELSVHILQSIPGYVSEFKRVFGTDKIDIDKVTAAISAFEETLVTPNSRFDKWLKGDQKALSKDELEGYKLFRDSGCVACGFRQSAVHPRACRSAGDTQVSMGTRFCSTGASA